MGTRFWAAMRLFLLWVLGATAAAGAGAQPLPQCTGTDVIRWIQIPTRLDPSYGTLDGLCASFGLISYSWGDEYACYNGQQDNINLVTGVRAICEAAPPLPLGCASGEGGFFVCPGNSPPSSTPNGPAQNFGGPPPSAPPADGPADDGPSSSGWGPYGFGGGGTNTCTNDGPKQAGLEGDPVFAGTGNVLHTESDYTGAGPALVRTYNSASPGWVHNHMIRVIANATTADVVRPDGKLLTFTGNGVGAWQSNSTVVEKLEKRADGGWQFTTADDSVGRFDAAGLPISRTPRHGRGWTYQTANRRVQSVTDFFGRRLSFTYDTAGRVSAVVGADGQRIAYAYDAQGRLASATFADGVSRQYLYAGTSLLMTAVVDENGVRANTWSYDPQGRAIESARALGAQRITLAYGANTTTVSDAHGRTRTQSYADAQGRKVFRGQDAPCANCWGDANTSLVDFVTGLTLTRTDYLGITTMYSWDFNRKLPIGTTQAYGRAEERTTRTQWHPQFRLPVRIEEPGRITSFTYDAKGNWLSQTIEATASAQSRTWQRTYGPTGLLESATDPRGGVTRYVHDAQGQLTQVTDAAGGITRFGYDAAGCLAGRMDPGGLGTNYAYDVRGRLVSQLAGNELTRYTYTPGGRLRTVVFPDGLTLTYGYDDAQRLTSVSDNRGASIVYTLDAMGNRVREEARDSVLMLSLARTRVIDTLDRVSSVSGGTGQATRFAYDANGNAISATDPLNQTTRQTLDALRRPVSTTFPDNTAAGQGWTALDDLASVTDPKGVQTRYVRNVFGEVTEETSPDIGTIRYTRDAAGNVIITQDARGKITLITRDPLGRITAIDYGPGHQVKYTYDAAGYVSKVEDKSGVTSYTRDDHGRILSKTQDVADSTPASRFQLRYGYDRGVLASITYPSGMVVSYPRIAGRIFAIEVRTPSKPDGALLSGLTYTALGQPKSWVWSTGEPARRTFDADGRMTANEFASYTYDGASRITGITQNLFTQGTPTADVTPWRFTAGYDKRGRITSFGHDSAQTRYTYDANGNRLTATDMAHGDSDLEGQFDVPESARTTAQKLTVPADSNRLLGMEQKVTTAVGRSMTVVTTPISYGVDAAGNLTSDGLRMFEYDGANRLSKVRILKDGEAASVSYLHNAMGQRVFQSEPQAEQTLPNQANLGAGFVTWLKNNFGWMFVTAGATTSIGTAYVYGDSAIPPWAILGDYDNGSAQGNGANEYIWLPLDDGSALPLGLYKGGKLYAIHTDHLGTPRLMKDDQNKAVWQWPYSAFGTTKPTGILRAVPQTSPEAASPVWLKATEPAVKLALRHPGQMEDSGTGMLQNFRREYDPKAGRYKQFDPIGLQGGPNGYS